MKLAVISDLHVGAADGIDAFGHEDAAFVRFLRFLERNFEKVVLLGDVWETMRGRLPGRDTRELRRSQAAHPRLAERFARPPYVYLHGNHDLVAQRVLGAPASLTLELDGLRLLFHHGHHYDWLFRYAPVVPRVGSWLGGMLLRLGMGSFFARVEAFHRRLHGDPHRPEGNPFQRWALALAEARGADVVVTGHTHQLARLECGGRVYLNSGACNHGQLAFATLDTRRGHFGVHDSW